MNTKQGLFSVMGVFFSCSIATAGSMGPIASFSELHPVISLQGGYASINAGEGTRQFTGSDADLFTYNSTGDGKGAGFIGAFLGVEQALSWMTRPGFFIQTGVEYNHFEKIGVRGTHTVGIEPSTSTLYNYSYNFQTQQVLGTLKLFATTYERYHPYGEIGLGAAFNHAGQYNATTVETGSINLTPAFDNQNQTQFSYSLGLGVDVQVNTKIRAGIGYRYSNFGSSTLGNGVVTFNNYQAPVSFSLGSSNTYANQLIARISYVV